MGCGGDVMNRAHMPAFRRRYTPTGAHERYQIVIGAKFMTRLYRDSHFYYLLDFWGDLHTALRIPNLTSQRELNGRKVGN
jgi:hypothetical protein